MNNFSISEINFSSQDFSNVFGRHPHEIPDEIRSSWIRSVSNHRLDPNRINESEVLTHAELLERRASIDDLSAVCLPEMDRLLHRVMTHAEVVMLSDASGAVVQYRSTSSVIEKCSGLRILPGSVWTEERQGTTGVGLCLHEKRPLSIVMNDHFSTHLSDLSCTVAPIFGESGRLAAVLNVTSMQNTNRATQSILRELISNSARRIENVYFERRNNTSRIVRISRYDDFSDLSAEARLAIDENGRIIDSTPFAQQLLSGIDDSKNLQGSRLSTLAGVYDLERWLQENPQITDRENGRLYIRLCEPVKNNKSSSFTEKNKIKHLIQTNTTKKASTTSTSYLEEIIGNDSSIQDKLRFAQRLYSRKIPLLLQGESGSGKTKLAKALHESDPGKTGSFVTINCAAIPQDLIESELFGYRSGAFTGASKQGAPGRLVMANGGTLFLDEIGDMPLHLQGRLLQVLSEGEFVPVGAVDPVNVCFSLISASLRDLPGLVKEGKFREDLYYRLNGAIIEVPPLRTRSDRMDIIESVFRQAAHEIGCDNVEISEEVRRVLMKYSWPGNIRELHHVAKFAVAMNDSSIIQINCLPPCLGHSDTDIRKSYTNLEVKKLDDDPQSIANALERTGWNVSGAAKLLGISRATMHRRLVEFGIHRPTRTGGESTV